MMLDPMFTLLLIRLLVLPLDREDLMLPQLMKILGKKLRPEDSRTKLRLNTTKMVIDKSSLSSTMISKERLTPRKKELKKPRSNPGDSIELREDSVESKKMPAVLLATK
jgi:hypothetical protein